MFLTSLSVVLLRFCFGLGWVWLQECVLYLHAFLFLFASLWTLKRDRHVRVDILYTKLEKPLKKKIDFIGALIFGLPMMLCLVYVSIPYVFESWKWLEKSSDSSGLPLVFILKTFILVFGILFALQILNSHVLRYFNSEGDH
jgi:TRAP-type mannitol/chloroaromatic compound transport system permease small subunit